MENENTRGIKEPKNYIREKTDVLGTLGDLEVLEEENLKKLDLDFHERKEGRTRESNITEALRLRVHDPLWMLMRQWQMGEFRGNNTGTAMSVRCEVSQYDCSKEPIEPATEKINPTIDLRVKIESAVHFLDMVRCQTKTSVRELRNCLCKKYPIKNDDDKLVLPDVADDTNESDLNSRKIAYLDTYKGKIFDGNQLYEKLNEVVSLKIVSESIADNYRKWFEAKYQPAGTNNSNNSHWQANDLCYDVESKAGGLLFKGDRYEGGRLSWYTFDYAGKEGKIQAVSATGRLEMGATFLQTMLSTSGVKSLTKEAAKALTEAYPLKVNDAQVKDFKKSYSTLPFDGLAFYRDLKVIVDDDEANLPIVLDKKNTSKPVKNLVDIIAKKTKVLKTADLIPVQNALEKGIKYCGRAFISKVETFYASSESAVDDKVVLSIPTPCTFAAAPNKRLWQMEDHKVYFGQNTVSDGDGTGVRQSEGNVVAMKYAMMYSNDWMLFPLDTEIGKYITVKKIEVYDSFGERVEVNSESRAGNNEKLRPSEEQWQVFTNSTRGERGVTKENGLYYAPQLAATIEGKPVEKVSFLRDEMANMVWGVEECVSDGCGGTLDADLYATRLSTIVNDWNEKTMAPYVKQTVGFGEVASDEQTQDTAKFRYLLQTKVPYNWIPFIPQHIPNNDVFNGGGREMLLRRGKMPCYICEKEEHRIPVRPMGDILRPALNKNGVETPMYINEEAVQSTGIKLMKNYQRARWIGGKTFTWFGIKKELSKTEDSSGLTFDELERK